MAAAPVSPEVAPRTFIDSPRCAHWVEIPQQLHREVLKRECGAVKQLQHVGARIKRDEGRGLRVVEALVRFSDEASQRFLRDVGREVPHEFMAELRVAEPRPLRPLRGQVGQFLGQEKPAIGSQPGGDGIGKAERLGKAPRGDEAHGVVYQCAFAWGRRRGCGRSHERGGDNGREWRAILGERKTAAAARK